MAQDIETKVREKISEQLGVAADEVTPEASFIEDLGADSLDIVELVMELEEEFEITIPDDAKVYYIDVGEWKHPHLEQLIAGVAIVGKK